MNELKIQNEAFRRRQSDLIDMETDTACNFAPITAETLVGRYDLEFNMADETPHLFYDQYSESYFKSTIGHVLQAEYHLNRNYVLRGWASVNEWYDFMGLAVRFDDDRIGWCTDGGMGWLDFEHHRSRTRSGLDYYIIRFLIDPEVLEEV